MIIRSKPVLLKALVPRRPESFVPLGPHWAILRHLRAAMNCYGTAVPSFRYSYAYEGMLGCFVSIEAEGHPPRQSLAKLTSGDWWG